MVTEPSNIARILRQHWEDIFKKRGVDSQLLEQWIRDDIHWRIDEGAMPTPMRRTRVKLKHVKKALRKSGNSAPGPDGIPYSAWRAAGDEVAAVLFEALEEMFGDNGEAIVLQDYAD